MRNHWKAWVLVAATLALSFAARGQAADQAQGTFERTLKVTGAVDLEVTTGSGSITVHPGDAATVKVVGTIRVSSSWRISETEAQEKVRRIEANPPIEQNGNTLRIGHIEDEDLRRNVSISYDVTTPAETRLHSAAGSGSQSIEGIRGPVQAETGSGSVRISGIGGNVRASTGSGGITLDRIQGGVRATAGSGSIRGTAIGGAIEAQTGSGAVEIEQTAPGDVSVQTGSGSVAVRGVHGGLYVRTGSGGIRADGTPSAEWRLRTGSGGIALRLPVGAAFDLRASTSSGSIHTTHPITVLGTVSRRQLRGKVQGGGVLVDVSTSSGSIRIE